MTPPTYSSTCSRLPKCVAWPRHGSQGYWSQPGVLKILLPALRFCIKHTSTCSVGFSNKYNLYLPYKHTSKITLRYINLHLSPVGLLLVDYHIYFLWDLTWTMYDVKYTWNREDGPRWGLWPLLSVSRSTWYDSTGWGLIAVVQCVLSEVKMTFFETVFLLMTGAHSFLAILGLVRRLLVTGHVVTGVPSRVSTEDLLAYRLSKTLRHLNMPLGFTGCAWYFPSSALHPVTHLASLISSSQMMSLESLEAVHWGESKSAWQRQSLRVMAHVSSSSSPPKSSSDHRTNTRPCHHWHLS